jgi:thiosulfate/3-mercaptopyruvate sulfurtransferase
MKLMKKKLIGNWSIALQARGLMFATLAAVTMLGAACGGGQDSTYNTVLDSTGTTATPITVNTPAAIAQESADDYNTNVNGLITATTLQSWIDDWAANRPAGITGRLVILQVSNGPANMSYITPNPAAGVLTYSIASSRLVETRTNGVIETQSMVPEGANMDKFFQDFALDPSKDMLVCAMGTGSTGNNMSMGRCWYMLRYWGVPSTHLALLNGGASVVMAGAYLSGDSTVSPAVVTASCDENVSTSCLPGGGTFSVRNLPEDNTALQATLEDMRNIAKASDVNDLTDGVFLWDARGIDQYSAGEASYAGTAAPGPAVANYMTTFQNKGSQQGHPNGALDLNFSNMLDSTTGYSYKPKSVLQSYLDGTPDANFEGFRDGSYQLVGTGNAYQPGDTVYTYCETTFRAMITGVVAGVILGKPTRFYDGAMVEWHSVSNAIAVNGLPILPADSPWRTDLISRSFFKYADSAANIATRIIVNPYASSANAIIVADKVYKRGGASSGTGGTSSTPLPPNPCGG